MKASSLLGLCLVGLALALPAGRAETLDDLITAMRKGEAPADPAKQKEIMHDAQQWAGSAYRDGIVSLYLCEIRQSIVDPENNGGWPYRTFLLENNPTVRKNLTEELIKRFGEEPTPLLAFALLCPALYAGDEANFNRGVDYLKEHDAFLYKIEQAHVDEYWRPYIRKILDAEAAGKTP